MPLILVFVADGRRGLRETWAPALAAGLSFGVAQFVASNYISVAELSALLHLPLGVIRILVSDLADQQYVRVHTSQPVEVNTGESPALSLSVLESVLNGISAL